MNSKELLIKAKEVAEKQLELAGQIEDAEETIDAAKEGKICFYLSGVGAMSIDKVVDPEKLQVVKDMALVAIMNFRDDKTKELEKLLGIRKPATINPEFEAAVNDMVQSVTIKKNCISGEVVAEWSPGGENLSLMPPEKPSPVEVMKAAVSEALHIDPVEEKLADILQEEAQRIETPKEDRSLDKYPAKKSKAEFPENMTKDAVSKMYVDDRMTAKQVAAHFGVSPSKVNTFLQMHRLFRGSYDKPAKAPEETERP